MTVSGGADLPGQRLGPWPDRATVALGDWVVWQTAAGLAERTRSERHRIVLQAAAAVDASPLEFTPQQLLRWLASIEGRSSRLTYFRALQAWHRYLLDAGLREDDPTAKLPKPREPKRQPRPLATGALERLLASGIRRRTRAMILLAALGGLRVHEIAKVRGEDVDWDACLLRVDGKGGKVRWQPLPPLLMEVAATFPRSGWWFPSTKDRTQPMRRESVSAVISRAMVRAGVVGTAHQARHWLGTEALASGTDIRIVQELLGHERLATTQLYTLVSAEQKHAAVLRLPTLGEVAP